MRERERKENGERQLGIKTERGRRRRERERHTNNFEREGGGERENVERWRKIYKNIERGRGRDNGGRERIGNKKER